MSSAASDASRGTVVMLVDNVVITDSRVQKQARSKAERGSAVSLLGVRNKSSTASSWSIGAPCVRLITMPTQLSPRRHQYRHPFPRSLWAYRSAKCSSYREQEVRAHVTDQRCRVAATRVRGRLVTVPALRALLTVRKIESQWVGFRSARTSRLRERRTAMTAPIDRFTTWWWTTVMGDCAWRRLDPKLWDWELAYGPAIDRVKPDLKQRPAVVNAPTEPTGPRDQSATDVRAACGLADDVPRLVYSGVASRQRGVGIMIDALPLMSAAHVVLVVASSTADTVDELVERTRSFGVDDRLHVLPYVPVDEIVPYLSTAAVGVMPAHHWPNHEAGIATKMFECSHARLPIVVSDLKAMAEMVRTTGQGEVFVAEDVDSYVAAVKAVLADPGRYRRVYDPELLATWMWGPQADILDGVYVRVRGATG